MNRGDLILFVGLLIAILLLIYFIMVVKFEGGYCMMNPIEYYSQAKNLTCSCFKPY